MTRSDRRRAANSSLSSGSSGRKSAGEFDGGADRGRPGLRAADSGGVRPARPAGEGRGEAVTAENAVGLALAVALVLFLVAALLFPERF
ncbi:K(+)-transporting ATPase subunit F [Actinomadura bangladeshensis]|uniref:K(+)-transporting ATPase subunit F n=1 Tax=Actinomadura bangladeshensis TaxID=453573 RepID=A0A6L9QJI4_9ACTN|nr:K(+)-transporting ATPase subunit F [Actinomadura bangladeshensis]NED52770.1 K(+)-transporting ATPase subunit F [Micromonospora aurantiaca]